MRICGRRPTAVYGRVRTRGEEARHGNRGRDDQCRRSDDRRRFRRTLTLIVDRPVEAGGGGLGFNGGQLLNLAVAACISNDLFREAARDGIVLRRVRIGARSDYGGDPAVSGPIDYEVEIDGDAPTDRIADLVRAVDRIAEIPNSIRGATEVRLVNARINGSSDLPASGTPTLSDDAHLKRPDQAPPIVNQSTCVHPVRPCGRSG